MLLVQLEVLLESVLDVLVVENFTINDRAEIFKHHAHLSDRRRLDEVLDNFLLYVAHVV